MKLSTILRKAEALGKKQTVGCFNDQEHDSYCAMGVAGCMTKKLKKLNNGSCKFKPIEFLLDYAGDLAHVDFNYDLDFNVCSAHNLFDLIIHLNDFEHMTFGQIADFLDVSCGL